MTGALPPGLEGFHTRLTGGFLFSARTTRPDDWAWRDSEAFTAQDVVPLLTPVLDVAGRTEATTAMVHTALDAAAGRLGGHRDRLLTLVLSPGYVLGLVPSTLSDRNSRPPTAPETWRWMCWLTEAAVRHLRTSSDPSIQLLHPLADRLHYLVLSEPLRHRGDPDWKGPRGGRDPLNSVYGAGSWHVLTTACAQARRTWLAKLNAYQSHPFLAQAPAGEIESELFLLLLNEPANRSGSTRTLSTSFRPVGELAPPTADDLAVRADVVERHLLPRFRLLQVSRLASTGRSRRDPLRAAVLSTASAAVTLAGIGGFETGEWFTRAAVTAAASYLLLGVGAVLHGGGWTAQWLLRFPAAATLGLFALLAMPANWWSDPHPRWAWAPAALVVAALGYLVVEARNHGVSRGMALRRAMGVLAVGTVHALLLSLIILVTVAGTYTESGPQSAAQHAMSLHQLWHQSTGAAWQVLCLATAWSLSVGVFSQILWDDRPITASLAHLTWRDGG